MSQLLPWIPLLPLAGFVINGVLGTRLGGRRTGPGLVGLIACLMPLLAFAITVACFMKLLATGAPQMEFSYTWAEIGGKKFEIAFWFDRLSAVMTLVVTGLEGAGAGETTTSAEACVDAASTPAGAVCACAMAAMAVRPSPRMSRETPREGRWVAAGWPVGRSSSVVTRDQPP